MANIKLGSVIKVDWVDSIAPIVNRVWVRRDDLDNEVPVLSTIGLVVKVDRHAVTLASSWYGSEPDSDVSGIMTIPRAAIVDLWTVERQT